MNRLKKLSLMLMSVVVALPFVISCMSLPNMPGISKPGSSKPDESTNITVESESNPIETEVPPEPAINVPFLHGSFEYHGAGTVDLYLLDACNLLIDVEHELGKGFSKMWDTDGLYDIHDGVISIQGKTSGCNPEDLDNTMGTQIPPYLINMDVKEESDHFYRGVFDLRCEQNRSISVNLEGLWNYDQVFLKGEYNYHGAGTAELRLINSREFVLDVENVSGNLFGKMWDTKGTYTIERQQLHLKGITKGCSIDDPDNYFGEDVPPYSIDMWITQYEWQKYKMTFLLVFAKEEPVPLEMFGRWPLGH